MVDRALLWCTVFGVALVVAPTLGELPLASGMMELVSVTATIWLASCWLMLARSLP